MTPQENSASSSTLADRLDAARRALALLLGEQFQPALVLARERIALHMERLGMQNPLRAAVDLACRYAPQEDMAPLLLLVAALDLAERPSRELLCSRAGSQLAPRS